MSAQDSRGPSVDPTKRDSRRISWSERQGRGPNPFLTGVQIRELFVSIVSDFESRGMLQESFGFECVDVGQIPGTLGLPVSDRLLLILGREGVWPITSNTVTRWDEDTLLDMVEFMFDYVSEGNTKTGDFHGHGECGWHFNDFDTVPARTEFHARINELLARLNPGYELSSDGHVLRTVPSGMNELLNRAPEKLDTQDSFDVSVAIEKFRSRNSDQKQRKDAVRDLADVLERMRPDVKSHMFSEDEGMLFEIANKFWIRHNKPNERRDYDHEAWWSWLFYMFLDSIALVSHLRDRQDATPPP